jgi:hypothetical protein
MVLVSFGMVSIKGIAAAIDFGLVKERAAESWCTELNVHSTQGREGKDM